jgi:hypothetical protein
MLRRRSDRASFCVGPGLWVPPQSFGLELLPLIKGGELIDSEPGPTKLCTSAPDSKQTEGSPYLLLGVVKEFGGGQGSEEFLRSYLGAPSPFGRGERGQQLMRGRLPLARCHQVPDDGPEMARKRIRLRHRRRGALLAGMIARVLIIQKLGNNDDATTSAGSALIFGMIALMFSIAALVVSTVAPSGGSLGQIALGGELALAVSGALFAVFAFESGLMALTGGPDLDGLAGLVGAGFGAFSLWASYSDLTTIYGEG